MSSFSWSPSYLVGHAEIDAQHQALLAALERVIDAVRDHRSDRITMLEQWLHAFARHAHAEERLMAALTSPGGITHAHIHAGEHASFLHAGMAVRAGLLGGDTGWTDLETLGIRLVRMDILGLDFEMIGHLLREDIIQGEALDSEA